MTIIDLSANASSQLTELTDSLPYLLQPEAFPRTLLCNASAAVVSFIGTELARDFFHLLGHRWRWLLPHHLLHHTAYKPGYIKRLSHYYRSLLHHEIPESLTMVAVAGTCYLLTCYRPELGDYQIGCGVTLMHTLKGLGITFLRACKVDWAIKADKNHQPVPLTAPPSQWWVNAAYHYRHHFDGDPNAYFSGIISLFDKAVGTALSLKGRTIAFVGELGELESPLKQRLQEAGARFASQGETIDLESTTVFVVNLNTVSDVGPQAIIQQMEQFLATVNGNEAIISKEIWLMLSDAESALALTSLDVLYQRYLSDWVTYRRTSAPCVLRKIIIGSQESDRTTPKRLARRIVRALHRDSRNIVIRSHPLVHLYQPIKEWMTATYLQAKH